jgi:putative ABC transport system permease protein
MFKNYFKVGIRNIVKFKTFSFINIFGLAVGMAVSLLIILMLTDQNSYDQFNIKKDRIYRVHSKVKNSAIANASSPIPLAGTLKENYPIVQNATSLVPGIGGDAIYTKGKYAEIRGFFADEQFFDVFSFELEEGNKQDALNNPNTMIITADVAYKLFNDESAIGKTIQFSDRSLDLMKIDLGTGKEEVAEDWGAFIITGVIDLSKYKSHIKFDMLVSSASLPRLYQEGRLNDRTNNWLDYSVCYTYILLQEGASATDFQTALNEISHIKFEEF